MQTPVRFGPPDGEHNFHFKRLCTDQSTHRYAPQISLRETGTPADVNSACRRPGLALERGIKRVIFIASWPGKCTKKTQFYIFLVCRICDTDMPRMTPRYGEPFLPIRGIIPPLSAYFWRSPSSHAEVAGGSTGFQSGEEGHEEKDTKN